MRSSTISTHTPLAGCDVHVLFPPFLCSRFQLTHPSRGATPREKNACTKPKFQLTHPSRGATSAGRFPTLSAQFQLTHPSRGATRARAFICSVISISTHTPLAGCDAYPPPLFWWVTFQLTHPSRGATLHFVASGLHHHKRWTFSFIQEP